jgi:hypothetical protein
MKTFNMPQGSPEWNRIRRGVVTASEIKALITPNWKPRTGAGVKTYLHKKIAEKLMAQGDDGSEEDVNTTPSWTADQGKVLENIAIPWFEFETNLEVQRVGFCLSDDGKIGCSPDGLIGEDSGIETKCPQGEHQIEWLLDGKVPDDHIVQVHSSMLVTGRPYWWFVSYSNSAYVPNLVIKVQRDEEIISKLSNVIYSFLQEFDREYEKVKEMGHALIIGGQVIAV